MVDHLFTSERRRRLILKRGKERVIANRHPWIFAGAIHAERGPEDAAIAELVDSEGTRIATGLYSKQSQIRLRALTFGEEELSASTIVSRIEAAVARRRALFDEGTNAARLVHAEGDELSSIVVDRYDDVLVVELSNRGIEQLKPLIVETLARTMSPRAIYFKNDLPARKLEGLPSEDDTVILSEAKDLPARDGEDPSPPSRLRMTRGRDLPGDRPEQLGTEDDTVILSEAKDLPSRDGEDPSPSLRLRMTRGSGEPGSVATPIATTILESGLRFHVDPAAGQKTGFFLDQRENRRLARELSGGKRVLNLFSYTGAFGVYAAAGGASAVTNVDISAQAIEVAKQNHSLNGSEAEFTVADAFQYVRQHRERYDLLICDPPAFAKSRNDVERAARGYKDVNLYAMRMIEPRGLMMTFSCSGHISVDLFQKIIFSAALDAGRRVSFVRRLTAGPDHPVSLFCPEGEYLKGFLLEVR